MIVVILVLLLGMILIGLYNSLIFRKNGVDQCWGGIQTYLKNRADLIPNLVSVIKDYTQHEQELLAKITELRSSTLKSNSNEADLLRYSDQLTQNVKRLLIAVEAYPELKANHNYLHLQSTLVEIEDKISASRRAYNAAIVHYNNGIEMIPHKFVAALMSLTRKTVFEASPEDQKEIIIETLLKKKA